ncbi:MAG: methylated-DNA--[protein]-cysteine S-methyltransferase [Actinobacteria bacterium]|nr:methylated-DNA--[protein]-cysteine S-methyltransferase [Actinomycetota bacterium]MBI3686273.1 methylated-DNA--[protein]-cysteine S-methyltransferase [Actinomycetota bacterium]
MHLSTVDTPTGPLTLVADDAGALRGAGFGSAAGLLARLGTPAVRQRSDLGAITQAVRAYLAGDLTALDELPVEQPGGPFMQQAWKVLRTVPPGHPISYADLAARAGSPRAVRAAGQACARNVIAPVVPCHRVVRTDSSLGGYAYGLPVKRWLLDHESGSLRLTRPDQRS